MFLNITASFLIIFSLSTQSFGWGFFAHKLINRQAIFSLPPEMVVFYKKHINFISENAVNPDKRRYAVEKEAPRHFIDIDHYGDSALYRMPHYWANAVDRFSEDTLQAYGIVPWHIHLMKSSLTRAFAENNLQKILLLSADLGHYIADANVPLHTSENYNGQLTGQYGIHGFWESRLPELYHQDYDLFVGKSQYVSNPQEKAWEAVTYSHLALDSVLLFERSLTRKFPEDKKFSFEERGHSLVRVYSQDFSYQYHRMMSGMVERRIKASIKMVADFWYTCWVDAGQPDLSLLRDGLSQEEKEQLKREKKGWLKTKFKKRSHQTSEN